MYENNNGMNYNQTQVNYSNVASDPQVEAMVDEAFKKGLAATIMAEFPITSIIAIPFGSAAQQMVENAKALAAQRGVKIGGKNVAARILGTIGKIAGIVMTIFWAFYFIMLLMIFSNI